MMRFRHRYFHSGKARPFPSRSPSCEGPVLLLSAIDSRDPEVASFAMRGLGLICYLELGEPNRISSSLILLFEHYARFADLEAVRKASIDALCSVRALSSLKCITFEPGSDETRRYRDKLLEEFRAETC